LSSARLRFGPAEVRPGDDTAQRGGRQPMKIATIHVQRLLVRGMVLRQLYFGEGSEGEAFPPGISL
jgi:hypothetical protein